MLRLEIAVVLSAICLAQTPQPSEPLRGSHPGLLPPKLLKQVPPEYSEQGLEAGVQGISLYEIVIDEKGMATDLRLLSPLGYGLDERARQAILQWRFYPARLNGEPVSVYGQIEVSFRLRGVKYNIEAEHQRTGFNRAMDQVKLGGEPRTRGIESILKLSKEGFPAALHAEGKWHIAGGLAHSDPVRGRSLLREAANLSYPPALYEYGVLQLNGDGVPMDEKGGLRRIFDASRRGNAHAQFFLGRSYERGSLVKKDRDQAMEQFQLCAAQITPMCQYRLARLLLDKPKRKESDLLQAAAWLQLASGHGVEEARKALDAVMPQLTPEQLAHVDKLRPLLEKRPHPDFGRDFRPPASVEEVVVGSRSACGGSACSGSAMGPESIVRSCGEQAE
ncbi:MAG TPA: TonB family protein [Bryobacteraceae bacterium]|nr:TonB family protein [Bryobacteraceae bacterium]HPT28652.1 TonB family protein [Bryobacteraceae bacterium]